MVKASVCRDDRLTASLNVRISSPESKSTTKASKVGITTSKTYPSAGSPLPSTLGTTALPAMSETRSEVYTMKALSGREATLGNLFKLLRSCGDKVR